jgi:hypothetical protein
MSKQMFDVDKEGLAKLAERRGKAFILYELLQNGWDAKGASKVSVVLTPLPGKPYAEIVVEDDSPDGFHDLAHAWTLFAKSEKLAEPTLRGRFNLGEKLVIACCRWAEIVTTTGGVRFDSDGRHTLRQKREHGSVFRGEVRMTRDEYEEVCRAADRVLPEDGIETSFNGMVLVPRKSKGVESLVLPTEMPDEEGYMRRRERSTEVRMYDPREGEVPTLYEMGIPIMELEGDKYHADIRQKIPLSMERENGVHPSYLRKVRTAVLNTMAHEVTKEEAGASWVKDALSSPDVDKQAVETVLTTAFGKLRVTYDPSDPEANNRAMAEGYTVIPSASLPGEAWTNVRRFEASRPAGQVTPSPRPFSLDGDPLKTVDEAKWTVGIKKVVAYATLVAERLLKRKIRVTIANDVGWPHGGAFGPSCELYLNLGRLGHAWFNGDLGVEKVDALLIHEFAHYKVSNHLSADYYSECCRLGAAMKSLAAAEPVFRAIW